MKERKVFNIGFHKTGTTSLTQFMREHGFKSLHSVSYSMQALGLGSQGDGEEGDGTLVDLDSLIDEKLLDNLVRQFDYFSDNPWPLLFKRLDQVYPDSLFILTRRKVDSWINSLLKYTSDENTRMRQMIYGYGNPHRHISRYRKVYLSHNRAVEEYFGDRKNFMAIDLEEDNSVIAQRLQEFLGVKSGSQSFPSLNKGGS
jgi:Sulfotransferase domain